MRFEWDDAKNKSNQEKHGVSFESARECFVSGVEHTEDAQFRGSEERFVRVARLANGVLVVVYTVRVRDVIRIISVRRANRRELKRFSDRLCQ